MSKLGAKTGLELARGLKEAISEFAEREAAIEKELRSGTFAAKRKFDKGREEEENVLNRALEAAEADLKEVTAVAEAKRDARAAWIERADTSSRRLLLQRTQGEKGRTVSELQVQALEDREQRKLELEQTAGLYQQLGAELAEEEGNLASLERRAKGAMRGYLRLQRMLKPGYGENLDLEEVEQSGQTPEFLERVRSGLEKGERKLEAFKQEGLPRLLSFLPPWLLMLLGVGGAAALSRFWEPEGAQWGPAGALLGSVLVFVLLIQLVTGRSSDAAAHAVAEEVERTRRLRTACRDRIGQRFTEEQERLSREIEELKSGESRWQKADEMAEQMRKDGTAKLEEKLVRVKARNEKMYQDTVGPLMAAHEERVNELKAGSEGRIEEMYGVWEAETTEVESASAAKREAMEAEWKARIGPIYGGAAKISEALTPLSPAWEKGYLERWSPSRELVDLARFGKVSVEGDVLAVEEGLTLAGATGLEVPLALQLPHGGSVLIETDGSGRETAIGAINNIILRLLANMPPGKLNFTVIDPVGLGENFAGVMHLADYEDSLISGRIWTQRGQIEERLAELNEHIEKVIQMYLRNEYETISEYNEKAGNIAEKYYFLVIADFPSNFSETAVKRLQSIATTGARCGIFTLIHWDHRQAEQPQDFVPDTLRENSIQIRCQDGKFLIGASDEESMELAFDAAPDPELAIEFIQKIGKSSIDSNRVEVPFAHVMPQEGEFWASETTGELRVPIGRTGATKLQYLAIGKGTRQHALFAGKTGSGKSTLFHVIITNLALWCSPEEVEFYLVDFKKGVEFKCYAAARLPHARVVAIESDREFGLSVLKRVDDELRRRGDLFRKLGVQDVAGYKRAGGTEPLPRSLLIIDEFQELFVDDDRIAQDASVLLDRIVRQGRAFGIHVLLGSQTLGGAYTMARTTMGQMVIRVALQCNESDAYLIMDDTNPAPRMLTRPGEGIYNDSAGAIEGNSPFQVVWLPDEERDEMLEKVNEIAADRGYKGPAPIVFEGNAPSDVRENELLHDLLHAESVVPTVAAKTWLGAPNSIKGPTEAVFHRQSGNNLIVIGQREEAALAIIGISMVSIAAQYPKDGAKFILCDGTAPGSSESAFLEAIAEAVPQEVRIAKNHDIPQIMNDLTEEMKRRSGDEAAAVKAPPVFLIVENVQKFKKLKHEDDFDFSFDSDDSAANPGAQLNDLVTEGTSLGLHVIATVDTYNNLNRFLSRKALSEFEMRVIFQMSANDSAALVDSPAASNLGLHRAFFYNEHEGYLETFRPYALPGSDWIEEAKRELERLSGELAGMAG